jgi:DNA-binding CsgD family transcriptional regulator
MLRPRLRRGRRAVQVTPQLTLREIEVLWLIAHGCTYASVGAQLGISAHTVAAHIKNMYRKLDVHSAGAAVMRAIELRLLVAGAKS